MEPLIPAPFNPSSFHIDIENQLIPEKSVLKRRVAMDYKYQLAPEKPVLKRSVAMDYKYQLWKEELTKAYGQGGWPEKREEGLWERFWGYCAHLWERLIDN
jgi:hypothetical protein